jgi:hypothetical protein
MMEFGAIATWLLLLSVGLTLLSEVLFYADEQES